MARCIALYNNLLHGLNAGLAAAQRQLDADRERGAPDAAAQRRFKAVARRVCAGDPAVPMMVDRWLDLSATHGFATMMSDRRAGCCFNDASIMFNWSAQRGVPDVAYASAADRGVGDRRAGGGDGAGRMAPRARSAIGADSGGSSPASSGTALPPPRARRHDSMNSAQATRAAFRTSRTFRSEMTAKAKLLCRFRDMLEDDDDGEDDEDDDEDDDDDGDSDDGGGEDDDGDEAGEVHARGSMRHGGDRCTGASAAGVAGASASRGVASSCSISFLGEDGAEGDPGCTEALLKVRGLDESHLVHVRGWQRYKSPRAVAFRLSNDSIHIKIDLGRSGEEERCEEDFVLDARCQVIYYRGVDGNGWTCNVVDVSGFCFSTRFHTRLAFCSRVLARFVSQQ